MHVSNSGGHATAKASALSVLSSQYKQSIPSFMFMIARWKHEILSKQIRKNNQKTNKQTLRWMMNLGYKSCYLHLVTSVAQRERSVREEGRVSLQAAI